LQEQGSSPFDGTRRSQLSATLSQFKEPINIKDFEYLKEVSKKDLENGNSQIGVRRVTYNYLS
jgi:hypothetical protein